MGRRISVITKRNIETLLGESDFEMTVFWAVADMLYIKGLSAVELERNKNEDVFLGACVGDTYYRISPGPLPRQNPVYCHGQYDPPINYTNNLQAVIDFVPQIAPGFAFQSLRRVPSHQQVWLACLRRESDDLNIIQIGKTPSLAILKCIFYNRELFESPK